MDTESTATEKPGDVRPDHARAFRRMPPAKTVAEGRQTSGDPLSQLQDTPTLHGPEAEKALREYVAGVHGRLQTVLDLFKDCPKPELSPVSAADFSSAIQGQLCYVTMVYVITGTFPVNASTGAIKKDPGEIMDIPAGMGSNPAVEFALASGVNPFIDDE
jgi:hypothetical protein